MSIDDLLDRSAPPVPLSDAARDELHRLTGIRPARPPRRALPLALLVAGAGGLLAAGAAAGLGVATATAPSTPTPHVAADAVVVHEWHDQVVVADVVHHCLLRVRLVNEAGAGANPAFTAIERLLGTIQPTTLPADPGQGPLLGSGHTAHARAVDVVAHQGGAVVLAADQHLAAQHLDASAVGIGYDVSCD